MLNKKKHILTVARGMNSFEQVTVQMFFGETAELPSLLDGAHQALDRRHEQLKKEQDAINAAAAEADEKIRAEARAAKEEKRNRKRNQ